MHHLLVQTQLAINNMIASYELKIWDFLIWALVIEDLCKIVRSIVSCESKFLDFLIQSNWLSNSTLFLYLIKTQ
jgi:hypothetical protein